MDNRMNFEIQKTCHVGSVRGFVFFRILCPSNNQSAAFEDTQTGHKDDGRPATVVWSQHVVLTGILPLHVEVPFIYHVASPIPNTYYSSSSNFHQMLFSHQVWMGENNVLAVFKRDVQNMTFLNLDKLLFLTFSSKFAWRKMSSTAFKIARHFLIFQK